MIPAFELPDDATMAWIGGVLGPFEVVSRFAHAHGYSKLWRLEAGGQTFWLKMHAHPHKWAGEVHALKGWAPPLSPRVVAYRNEPPTVLFTEVPGTPAESIEFSPAAEERLWREAGAWLRAFHERSNEWFGNVRVDGSPHGEPSQDPGANVRTTFENRLRQGRDRGLLDEAEVDFAKRRFEAGFPSLAGATAHAAHRDFHPRNWLASRDGELTAVIDFEHARWDVRAADLNRPWDKEFARNPRLVNAFFEAYGWPDETFMAQIQTLRLMGTVASLVWTVEVGEPEYAAYNRVALHRMMREGE